MIKKIKRPKTVIKPDDIGMFNAVTEEIYHGYRDVFDSLTAVERDMVVSWLIESAVTGADVNAVSDVLWEVDYERKPVDIATFITDDYYLGQMCKTIHEKWYDDLMNVFAPRSTIVQWIFTGSIGSGKTTIAMAALAYVLYQLSCLRNPATYYGLLSDSTLVFGIYSITKRQVSDTGYSKVRGYIDTSPYFRSDFKRSTRIDSKIDFSPTTGKKIQVIGGSRELHAIGLDLFTFCLSAHHYIWTEHGPIKITEMVDKPVKVWTYSRGRYYLTDPVKAIRTGSSVTIPITMSNGQVLEPTREHRWLVVLGGALNWISVEDMRVGDVILTYGKAGDFDTVDCEHAHVIKIGAESAEQPVYDIVRVPKTHLFFTGTNPELDPLASHNCMDEVNFMRAKQDKTTGAMVGQAHDLYTATYDRIVSRFIRPGGAIPGLMMLMSSRKAQTSFLEDKIKNADLSRTYISDYALWEVKPKTRWIMPWFKVEVGDKIHQPRVLSAGQDARPGAKVIDVPGELRPTFLEDIDRAIRDVAGLATHNVSPFLRDRESLQDAVRGTMVHPFTREEVSLDVRNSVLLDDFFITKAVTSIKRSKPIPKMNPLRSRYIHVDLALTGDCAGIAVGHISGMVRRTRLNALDGTYSEEAMPFIIIDFMLRIRPPAGSEIDLSKIRAFILFISRMYPVLRATFDGYQSADSQQLLNKIGVESGLCSVDRTDGPYTSLRSALFDRRIAMYHYQPFIDEMLDLEFDWKTLKVDHPMKSSKGGKGCKDVADAVAGVVSGLLGDARALNLAAGMDASYIQSRATMNVVDPTDAEVAKNRDEIVRTAKRAYDLNKLRENV